MKTIFYLVVLFALVASCSVKTSEKDPVDDVDSTIENTIASGFNENDYESFLNLTNYTADTEPNRSDVQIIDSTSVIVINPTEEQIKEMEEKYGDDFYTIADDNSFYQYEATARLDSMNIKTISAEKPFLKLIGNADTWILDIRKEGAPEWNMIFFHKNKKPEIISSIDVTQEKIREYFVN